MDRPERGFTLVELMVAIAVAAIVLGFGVPGFQAFINGNQLAASANELVASLQTARMEAIRRNRRVVVCASGNANGGDAARCTGGAADGWITFVDNDRSNAFGPGDTLLRNSLLDGRVDMPAFGAVVFRSDGLARDTSGAPADRALRLAIDTEQPRQNVRCIEIRTSGAVSVQTPAANDGACG